MMALYSTARRSGRRTVFTRCCSWGAGGAQEMRDYRRSAAVAEKPTSLGLISGAHIVDPKTGV